MVVGTVSSSAPDDLDTVVTKDETYMSVVVWGQEDWQRFSKHNKYLAEIDDDSIQ